MLYVHAVSAGLAFASALAVHGAFAWAVGAFLALGVLRRPTLAAGCAFGAAFALVAGAGHIPWAWQATRSYFGLSAASASVALALAALLCGAGAGAVLGFLGACLGRLPERWVAPAIGCAWVSWEWMTTAIVPYYPWTSLAVTQVHQAEILRAVRWIGEPGLSFVVACAGASLGLAFHARRERRRAWAYAAAACALPALAWTAGRVGQVDAPPAGAAAACSVAAIDAGIPSGELPASAVLERYEAATRAARPRENDLVVWPESALPASPEVDAALRARLRADAAEWGGGLLAGGPRVAWKGDWQPRVYNSVYAIEARGPLWSYDKRFLVPFAEYWPSIGFARPLWLAIEETSAGDRPGIVTIGGCRLGVLVCFEGNRSELVRELASAGVDAVLVLTNDAALPERAVALEVSHLRLRAAEAGVEIVRAANRGVSARIDSRGRLLERSEDGVLRAVVTHDASPSPAARWAWVFRSLCVAASLLAAASSSWLRQRERPSGDGEHSLSKLSR